MSIFLASPVISQPIFFLKSPFCRLSADHYHKIPQTFQDTGQFSPNFPGLEKGTSVFPNITKCVKTVRTLCNGITKDVKNSKTKKPQLQAENSSTAHCGNRWRRETQPLLTRSCARAPLVSGRRVPASNDGNGTITWWQNINMKVPFTALTHHSNKTSPIIYLFGHMLSASSCFTEAYTALFYASKHTHCAPVVCDSKSVTVALHSKFT